MSDIRANTISDASGNGPINLKGQSAAKAWACVHMNFYLEESFNISTATDLGAAVGSVTLTNSMDTDTYRCGVALALLGGGAGSGAKVDSGACNSNTLSFSSFDGNNSVSGNVRVGSVIHGDLA